mgnify:CR=1 FL=1
MSVEVFDDLIGETLRSVRLSVGNGNDVVIFEKSDGVKWFMYHPQNCCEYVTLEEVIGDLSDLEDSPLLMAEVVSSEVGTNEWTFYKFRTAKGDVTFRWCGDLDSYYSIEVTFGPHTGTWIPSELRDLV